MPSAEEQTELLARRIQGILDAQMRTAYLRHTLLSMQPQAVADLLSVARAYAEARQPRHAALLSCLGRGCLRPKKAGPDQRVPVIARAISLKERHSRPFQRMTLSSPMVTT